MYKQKNLKNGLKIITSSMPHMESVAIGLWIGVGGRYEEKRRCGMSHLIEHMLFKGTESRTANMLKEAIEGVGGTFNAFTGEEETCYYVKLPSAYTELGLDVLSDMALYPKLDPTELEKEKRVICEEIKMYKDQPAHYVFDILTEEMWPNHAMGRPIAGYIDTVKAFKRSDVTDFKSRYYQPSNMSIVACGKIDRKKILAFAKNIFSMASKKRKFPYKMLKKSNLGSNIRFFRKETEQTHIAFGFHTVPRTHKFRYAVSLLNVILGANMSSRLFDRLREKKALCYDISSGVKKYKETGAFTVHAGVDNNKLFEASKEIVHELKDIKKSFVTADELHRAKEYAKGQLLLVLEDTASRMMWLGEKIVFEGKAPRVKELFKKVEKVTERDIRNIANTTFDSKKMNFATIGPAGKREKNKIREALTF